MKIGTSALSLLGLTASTASAFSPSSSFKPSSPSSSSLLLAQKSDNNNNEAAPRSTTTLPNQIKNIFASTVMAATLWASPPAELMNQINTNNNNIFLNNVQSSIVADAKEMASGSGSRVNKDPESLLRLGLPIPKDKEVRKFQSAIEEIRQDIQTKRKAAALDGVKKVEKTLKSKSSEFSSMCREPATCKSIMTSMNDLIEPLESSLKDAQTYFNGSDQERTSLDKAYAGQDTMQKLLTDLEEQMVPAGYVTPVPEEYSDLPQLRGGRATVEFVLNKPENAPFDVEGVNYPEAKMVMIIDGYTSPVTGGNFVDLVQKGFYTNMKIQRSDGFVVQTGDPDGPADGYVGTPSKSVGKGKHGERLIPLETFVKGDKGPFYETTIEDEGRGGQATVLPFSSYGAMGWAREEYDPNSGSSQFFWLLFDSDLTPAGKNVLDGRYPCFGYVVEGADFLRDIKEDDVIVSAKVTSGLDKLVLPKSEKVVELASSE